MKKITIDKTLVLVGMMGCGKSSIGRRLAKKMNVPFKDLDEVIVENEKMSITEIFEKKGEPYFRQKELEVINDILDDEPCVLATGGGAFMNEKIRDLISKKGQSLWIDAEYDVLLERVSRKKTRPLLEKGDKAEILRDLMKKRCPIYALADMRVVSTDSPHGAILRDIFKELR